MSPRVNNVPYMNYHIYSFFLQIVNYYYGNYFVVLYQRSACINWILILWLQIKSISRSEGSNLRLSARHTPGADALANWATSLYNISIVSGGLLHNL